MGLDRRGVLGGGGALGLGLAAGMGLPGAAAARSVVTVGYAGSMGVVMDRALGPAFAAQSGYGFHGFGQAAMALAHLITAKSVVLDAFVSVSPGPIKVVEKAKLLTGAVPVASTEIVLAYSPQSKYAAQFQAATSPAALFGILATPGLRFGRTDPAADPQGAYVLYTLQLAALLLNQPDLVAKIAGPQENPAQIFAEPSLLARLEQGQIDATLGYESAVISQKLPYVKLPPKLNFSDPKLVKTWYAQAALTTMADGKPKVSHPGPLVFYAGVPENAANPPGGKEFVSFLLSARGQAIFKEYGYNPGVGAAI